MNWLPPNGELHGITMDAMLRWNLAAVFWMFILAQILLVVALLRRKPATDKRTKASSRRAFLFAWLLPLLAISGLYARMAISSRRLWAARREAPASSRPVEVEVTGVQFQWYFRYPGADGIFGTTRAALVNAPAGNPLGLDPRDPHSRDDIVSSLLVLPVEQTVEIRLHSRDVIHGFFIPGMRLKQDAIPGMTAQVRFTPVVTGEYPILCSQVCGLGHARMQAHLRVVSQREYRDWLAVREHARLAAESPGPGESQP